MNYLLIDNEATITKGDTGTPFVVEVGDNDGPWTLTDATVVLRILAGEGNVMEKTLVPTGAPGKASNPWGAAELGSLAAGPYPIQVKVVFFNGTIRFAPSKGFKTLTVQEEL